MSPVSRPSGRAGASQSGMTLVEVLVTLIVVSVGLLGIAALQLATLRDNQQAYVRSQASSLAGYILDRMRANQRSALISNDYVVALNGTGPVGTPAGNDLAAWQAEIDRLLPGGAVLTGGSITRNNNIWTVTIQWNELAVDRAFIGQDIAASTRTFVTRTEI